VAFSRIPRLTLGHQGVPIGLAHLLVNAPVGQQPHLVLEYGDEQQHAVGVPGAIQALPEKGVDGRLFDLFIDLAP
jgi:hypothetical protein